MIRSMTAFAGFEGEIDGTLYGWEIRAVNHRYLDINLRIPETLRPLESFFRTLISQRLKRGKIDCTLYCQQQAGNRQDFFLDKERLAGLIRVIREIESEAQNVSPSNALEILAWPGILIEQKTDPEELKIRIGEILQNALTRIIECREREGAQLAGIIMERCRGLEEQVRLVRSRLPVLAEKLRNKLHSRLEEISVEVDSNRFEQEIAFLLQKMDVDEEMERLATHIAEVERILEKEDVAGRRLDFLFQEMNREANTLGSKSIDQKTTQASVEMKVLIEQMREQVQNIE